MNQPDPDPDFDFEVEAEAMAAPDLAGHMATVGTTNQPLEICPSCHRAILYGALLWAGAVGSNLNEMLATPLLWPSLREQLRTTAGWSNHLVKILLEIAKVDFHGAWPDAMKLPEPQWLSAMDSFYRARTLHFTDPDGNIIFEPHDQAEGPDTSGVTV